MINRSFTILGSYTILGSHKDLEHMEIPKLVFLQLFHIFLWPNTAQEHLSFPTDNDQQLFYTTVESYIYLLHLERNTLHFPVNNFFKHLLGLKLLRNILQCIWICINCSLTQLFLYRYIFQYTRLSFNRFFTYFLGLILIRNWFQCLWICI